MGNGTQNGLAWVKGGTIGISDPGPGGTPATIVPCQGVEIFVLGKKIQGPVRVTSATGLEIRPVREEPSVNYSFSVSGDGLEAYVRIVAKDGVQYRLKDLPPAEVLILQVDRVTVPAVPDAEELMACAAEKGIVHGLDKEACKRACLMATEEPVCIARGTLPAPGKDGELEFLVPMEVQLDIPEDALRVDFRESVKRPDVKAGQTIAVKKLPREGVPGRSVTGKPVLPPKPADPKLRPGKGVELREQGELLVAVATVSGCPRYFQESGLLTVEPVYVHMGDVNLGSGNLKCSGNLEVCGQVTDGMAVECDGDVTIRGAVTDASIRASGSVRIGSNVFKSCVTAGKDQSGLARIAASLASVHENADRMLEVEAQIQQLLMSEDLSAGPALDIEASIPASVYHDYLRNLLNSLSELYKFDFSSLPAEVSALIAGTRDTLFDMGLGVFTKARIIKQAMERVSTWIDQELVKGKSDVIVPYLQNSRVEAARDIIVTGQGAFYSSLVAGRAVRVTGNPGLIRGGEVSAQELIYARSVGGVGSAVTTLKVPARGRIVAGIVYPNVLLIIGPFKIHTDGIHESVTLAIENDEPVMSTRAGKLKLRS